MAALVELILATMRRLGFPLGRQKCHLSPIASKTSIHVLHRRAEAEDRHLHENLDGRGTPALFAGRPGDRLSAYIASQDGWHLVRSFTDQQAVKHSTDLTSSGRLPRPARLL